MMSQGTLLTLVAAIRYNSNINVIITFKMKENVYYVAKKSMVVRELKPQMSRITFRELALKGQIPRVKQASCSSSCLINER